MHPCLDSYIYLSNNIQMLACHYLLWNKYLDMSHPASIISNCKIAESTLGGKSETNRATAGVEA